MLDILDGVRVVSFNHFLLGPVGVQALGDLGADVVAVEPLEGAFPAPVRRRRGPGSTTRALSNSAATATSEAWRSTSNRRRASRSPAS